MSQAIMFHDSLSKNFEIQYDGVQQLHQSSRQSIYQKNFLSGKGRSGPTLDQKYATLCLIIHSLRIFLKFCRMMRHNIDRKSSLCHFFEVQKHSIMLWCDSQTLIILANFPKKISFWTRDNFGRNYATLFSLSALWKFFLNDMT